MRFWWPGRRTPIRLMSLGKWERRKRVRTGGAMSLEWGWSQQWPYPKFGGPQKQRPWGGDGWVDTAHPEGWMHGWMDLWTWLIPRDGQTDMAHPEGWMDGSMDVAHPEGWMNTARLKRQMDRHNSSQLSGQGTSNFIPSLGPPRPWKWFLFPAHPCPSGAEGGYGDTVGTHHRDSRGVVWGQSGTRG